MGKENYILGSGKTYTTTYNGTAIPTDAELEIDDNLIGYTKGGASLEYAADVYDSSDDLGYVKIVMITKETVKLKTGIMSNIMAALKTLCSTARETIAGGKRTVKLGGLGLQNNANRVVRFVHKDALNGDIRVTIIGKNTAGFTLAFAQDKETIFDCEFLATPMDGDGTLVIFEESMPAMIPLTVTSVAGTTSGTTKITVTPAKQTTTTYKYMAGASITAPTYNQVLTTGWTIWDGSADITATTTGKIQIAEVDSNGYCKATGQATVTAKA